MNGEPFLEGWQSQVYCARLESVCGRQNTTGGGFLSTNVEIPTPPFPMWEEKFGGFSFHRMLRVLPKQEHV